MDPLGEPVISTWKRPCKKIQNGSEFPELVAQNFRNPQLQRDDARGHFRQIRRSDYEAARSICCWTSCSPFQIVGREPPDLRLILRPFGPIQATAVQPLPRASQGHVDKAPLGRPEPIPKKRGACRIATIDGVHSRDWNGQRLDSL